MGTKSSIRVSTIYPPTATQPIYISIINHRFSKFLAFAMTFDVKFVSVTLFAKLISTNPTHFKTKFDNPTFLCDLHPIYKYNSPKGKWTNGLAQLHLTQPIYPFFFLLLNHNNCIYYVINDIYICTLAKFR